MTEADLHLYVDPVCPFAWLTSRWVTSVQRQRGLSIDWRFLSLRLLNSDADYATQFRPGYDAGHTAGLRLLRVAARTRAEHGRDAVGPLYTALGERIFEAPQEPPGDPGRRGTRAYLEPLLAAAGLPAELADALEDTSLDSVVQAETDEALALTGPGVGTPVMHVRPPHGAAFFGPVISRLPADGDAVRLWDHVVGLAGFDGFAELKRSLRERPQLAGLGVDRSD